jgi:outer membrane receptor for monomeric catechols
MKLIATVLLVAAIGVSQAQAQNCQTYNSPCVKGTRVTANFQLSAPTLAAAPVADLTKTMATVSQSLYEIVNRECDVLSAVLKGECRVVQITVSSNVNDRMNNGVPFVNANANATFEIELKAPPKEAVPQ